MNKKRPSKVRPGDPIRAAEWNNLVDIVLRNEINVVQSSGLDIAKSAAGTTLRVAGALRQMLAYTSSSITARSGTTPGTGTVTPQRFNGTAISSNGQDLTVYSFSASAAIASGKYCWIEQDPGGYWWVTAVEC